MNRAELLLALGAVLAFGPALPVFAGGQGIYW